MQTYCGDRKHIRGCLGVGGGVTEGHKETFGGVDVSITLTEVVVS